MIVCFVAWCVIVPLRTSKALASTFHCSAARRVKSSRAVAAARRTAGTVEGVVRLPAVLPSSGTRAVSAITRRIRSTATRSSSAAACVSCAREPWPSSTLPVITVIVPSLLMWSRAATVAVCRRRRPDSRPAETPSVTVIRRPAPSSCIKERRLSSTSHLGSSVRSDRCDSSFLAKTSLIISFYLCIFSAARRTALRIFGYPLHRHRLTFIPAAISSSVGCGFFSSSATAVIIIPGVQ